MEHREKTEEAGLSLPEEPDLEALAEQLARAYEDAGIDLPGGEDGVAQAQTQPPTGDAGDRSVSVRDLDPLGTIDDPTVEELLELVVDASGVQAEPTAAADVAPQATHPQEEPPPIRPGDEEDTEPVTEQEPSQADAHADEELDSLEDEVADDWPPEEDGPVDLTTIVEALLFVGGKAVNPEEVAARLPGTSPEEVEQAIVSLAQRYASQSRPYRIVRTSKGYLLEVLPEFALSRRQRPARRRSVQLGPSALEVLAIVAYRQPVSLDEIDKLRGARSSGILKQLVARKLVEPVPGSENRKSRTRFRTTARFLQVFRLSSLGDLPRPDFSAATDLPSPSSRA